MKKWLVLWIGLVPCLLLCPPANASGIINGTIALTMPDGRICSAGWLRILLVRSRVAVPDLSGIAETNPYQQMETIRDLHMTFFIAARKEMSDPDFVGTKHPHHAGGCFSVPGGLPGNLLPACHFPRHGRKLQGGLAGSGHRYG